MKSADCVRICRNLTLIAVNLLLIFDNFHLAEQREFDVYLPPGDLLARFHDESVILGHIKSSGPESKYAKKFMFCGRPPGADFAVKLWLM